MSTPVPGAVCAWEIDASCCAGWDDYTPEVQATAAAWATEILDALTGRRFAKCPVKVRPCGSRCGWFGGYLTFPVGSPSMSGAGNPWMIPYIGAGGVWRNCTCGGACSCRATCEAHLPGPVAAIDEVMVGGVVIDPSGYRLDEGSILVRTDGDCWPECQNLDVPDTEDDTWSVTYRPGEPLPASAAIAAGKLACEFAKACVGAEGCALPDQLVSLSRNGVEVQVADPQLLLDAGLTGVQEADLFIRAYNPGRLKSRPFVLSPDIRQPRQVTL